MKKILSLGLAILVLLGMSASALTISDENVFPIVDEPYELTIWVKVGSNIEDMDTNQMTAWYEEKTGVHINWIQITEAATEKLNLSLSSGDYPDIYSTTFNTSQVSLYSEAGIFIPLDDLIADYGYNIRAAFEERPDIKEAITAPDGHIYTLFRTDPASYLLVSNKLYVMSDWLNAYCEATGNAAPVTVEEFENMLIYWRDNDMNGNGDPSDEIPMMGTLASSGQDFTYYLLEPFQDTPADYLLADAEGNVSFTANTEAYREGLKWITHLYNEGLIAEETFIQDASQLSSVVNKEDPADRTVGAFGGFWQGVSVSTASMTNGWDVYEALSPIEGPTGLRQASTTGFTTVNMSGAITTACKRPDIAMKWLDYWFSEEGMVMIDYGFEDVNWEWNDIPAIDGTVPSRTFLTNRNEPQNIHWYVTTVPYYRTPSSLFGRTPTDHVPYLYAGALRYEDYYSITGFPQFAWCDDLDLTAECNEMKTIIDDYVLQARIQFITGRMDINNDADWQSYLDTLNGMNLEGYLRNVEMVYFAK